MILNREFLAILGFTWGLAFTSLLLAQSSAPDSNFREACRLRVAGLFLDVYAQADNAKNTISLLMDNNQKLASKEVELGRELSSTQQKILSDYYNVELLEKKADIDAQIKSIQDAMAENTSSLKGLKAKLPELNQESEELRARILHLFYFQNIGGGGLGYHFQIQYREKCPSFDDSCALPKSGYDDLRKIFLGYDFPPACSRYIKQSQDQH